MICPCDWKPGVSQPRTMDDKGASHFTPVAISFLAVFVALLPFVAPDVAYDDSGEFAMAAQKLGIAHPPGYPLFALFGRIATLIPLGGPAFGTGLLSAACFSMAAAMAGWFAFILTSNKFNFIFVPLAFLGCRIPLSQALITEVHSLNLLLMTLAVGSFSIALASESIKPAFFGSFVLGLSMGNHHTTVLLFPPCFLAALWLVRKRGLNSLTVMLLVFLLGLTVLLFPPIRSSCDPGLDWWDTEDLGNYWKSLTRYQYEAGRIAGSPQKGLVYLGGFWFRLAYENLGPWVGSASVIALVWAVISGFRNSFTFCPVAAFLTVSLISLSGFLLYLLDFTSNSNSEFYNSFFMSPSLALAACLGATVLAGLAATIRKVIPSRDNQGPLRLLSIAAVTLALIMPVSLRAWDVLSSEDMSEFQLYRDFALAVMKALPDSAILLSSGDPYTFALWYAREVENLRRDITIIDTNLMVMPWYWDGVVQRQIRIPPPETEGLFSAEVIRRMRLRQLFKAYSESGKLFSLIPLEGIAAPDMGLKSIPVFPLYQVGRTDRSIPLVDNSEVIFSKWFRLRARTRNTGIGVGQMSNSKAVRKYTSLIDEAFRMAAISACNKGSTLISVNRPGEAEKWLHRARFIQPDDPDLSNIIERHLKSIEIKDGTEAD